MTQKPTVVFIESNTTGTGGVILQRALERGYEVHFLSANPARYPFLNEQWVTPLVTDTADLESLKETIAPLQPTVILTTSEYYLETAAHLASHFGLHGADPAAVSLCRHKGRLAEVLKEAGVSAPQSHVVGSLDELEALAESLTFPVVAKPAQGSGSIGVRLCRNAEELGEHATPLLASGKNERGLSVAAEVVVQSLIGGREYSVEVMGTEAGFQLFGITQKHLGAPPYFLEHGHDFPAELTDAEAAELQKVAFAALTATGLTRGPAHVELRLDEGRAYLIEINPRLAGGMIPVLIEQALDLDPLTCLLDFALTGDADLSPGQQQAASIRFLIPGQDGVLQNAPDVGRLEALPGIRKAFFKGQVGTHIILAGDFRDRLGWLISEGQNTAESAANANVALEQALLITEARVQEKAEGGFNEGTRQGLHPAAMAIVRRTPSEASRRAALEHLVAMDRAHLLMLVRAGLMPAEKANILLDAIQKLKDNDYGEILQKHAPRGTYLLYEDALIGMCGLELGGAIHLGRSRNDMNAAQFKLELREPFRAVNHALWLLRRSLVDAAERYAHVAMPVYSQYQPGLPGTYGFYLLGIEAAISRDQQGLLQLIDALNTSPLGGGAGGGTTLPIIPEITAELLGFEDVVSHAQDAVASRDLAPRILSTLAITGVTLSRYLQDLQVWTTQSFKFLNVPDNLTGGSSMMPQKRNPYLLEMAQGRAAVPGAALTECLQGMLKTPFSNSVQVGTESMKPVHRGIESLREAAVLAECFASGFTPNVEAMSKAVVDGNVMTTAMAEAMAASGEMSFRDAHVRLGSVIVENPGPAREKLVEAFPRFADSWPADVAAQPQRFAHGGGPGASETLLEQARERLKQDGAVMRACVTGWARAAAFRERQDASQAVTGTSRMDGRAGSKARREDTKLSSDSTKEGQMTPS